jgi:CDP-diacylglycerol--glycerol-3-phosphate 3-phosphatidyltransferase
MTSTNWQKKLPMQLTMARIALVVPVIACMVGNTALLDFCAAILFIVASVTDYYDGYFARKYNAISTMGKFMDPIADKILVSSILVFFVVQNKIDPYLLILIMSRDTFIGGIRAVAATDGLVIDAKPAGKWKTALQMCAIPAVIIWQLNFLPFSTLWIGQIGYFLLWVSAIFSITSGVEYYRAYKKSK